MAGRLEQRAFCISATDEEFARLVANGYLLKRADGGFTLTPEGRKRYDGLLPDVSKPGMVVMDDGY